MENIPADLESETFKMNRHNNIAAFFIIILAVAFNFWYMGFPVIILNAGLLISLFAWVTYRKEYPASLNKLFITGIILQIIHFTEEYYTGFHRELPLLFNRTEWTESRFLTFNIIWILILSVSAYGAYKKIKLSYLFIWFFIFVVGIGNGIMHSLLSLTRGGYFPGTVSAIFLFITGIIMLRRVFANKQIIKR